MALAADDLLIDQGTTWRAAWSYLEAGVDADGVETDPAPPPDFTAWSARAQIRARYGAPTALLTFSSDPDEEDAAGSIELRADGLVVLSLEPEATEGATWFRLTGAVWDLELTSPAGEVVRMVEGTATLRPESTLDAPPRPVTPEPEPEPAP